MSQYPGNPQQLDPGDAIAVIFVVGFAIIVTIAFIVIIASSGVDLTSW